MSATGCRRSWCWPLLWGLLGGDVWRGAGRAARLWGLLRCKAALVRTRIRAGAVHGLEVEVDVRQHDHLVGALGNACGRGQAPAIRHYNEV